MEDKHPIYNKIEAMWPCETLDILKMLWDYSKEHKTPIWELDTAFCSNVGHRRTFQDWSNVMKHKEYPKLTDEQFIEKARDFARKGKDFIYLTKTFFGDLDIQVCKGTNTLAHIQTKNGEQERLKALVKEYHSL